MKQFIIGLLIGLLYFISSSAYSCSVPPRLQSVPALELINRTNNIVLATVFRAELQDDGLLYTFKDVRVLKGTAYEGLSILGAPLFNNGLNSFNNHKDKEFWTNYGGRVFNGTDCEIRPPFVVGLTYLLFLDKPFHTKSFELIIRTHGSESVKDQWLQYVEKHIPNK